MIVNDVDLKQKYGNSIVWLNQTIQPRNIITYTEWLDTSNVPVKYKPNKYREFEIYLDVIVRGISKQDCELTMSNLLRDFDSGILELDYMDFLYKFDIKTEARELIKRWQYHHEITLNGYCKLGKKESIAFSDKTVSFNVKGTEEAPAVLTLTSDIALNELVISGVSVEDIVIKPIQRNSIIVLDGENPKVTENGTNILNKCELWEFPVVKPGPAEITLSSTCTGTIEYYPVYK